MTRPRKLFLVMSTLEAGGYFSSDEEVETLIKAFDNKYPNKIKMTKDIIQTLKLINKTKVPLDSIWFRLSSFFSLVVELIKYKREKEGKTLSVSLLRKKLIKLQELIENNKAAIQKKINTPDTTIIHSKVPLTR